jgi:hypothetical protein
LQRHLRRRGRASGRVRGAGDDRGRDHGAGAEQRRGDRAAARLPAARARDLRPLRHLTDRRRGDLRVRPSRSLVRLDRTRPGARYHDLRQGHHLRLRARSAATRPVARRRWRISPSWSARRCRRAPAPWAII